MGKGYCTRKTRFSLLSFTFIWTLFEVFLSYNIERYISDIASDRRVRPTCKCASFLAPRNTFDYCTLASLVVTSLHSLFTKFETQSTELREKTVSIRHSSSSTILLALIVSGSGNVLFLFLRRNNDDRIDFKQIWQLGSFS